MKKILALLIAAVMLLSVFAVNAYAAVKDNAVVAEGDDILEGDIDGDDGDNDRPTEPTSPANAYDLTVNGEFFTADKLTVACGGGTTTYDPEEKTLTLNNVRLNKTSSSTKLYKNAAVSSSIPELTVVLKGKNVFDEGKVNSYFLRSSGSVTFTGDGSVEMFKTESVYHEIYIEAENRWEINYSDESLQTDVSIEVDSDIAFNNVNAERLLITSKKNGDLHVSNSTLKRCDLTVPGNVFLNNSVIRGEQYLDKHDQSIHYYRSAVSCGKALSIIDCTLAQTDIAASKDAVLQNVSMDYSAVQTAGSLTAQKLNTFCTERTRTGYENERCLLSGRQKLFVSGSSNLKYTYAAGDNVFELNGITLEDCSLNAEKDLLMDSCTFYGTEMRIKGSFTCANSVGDAKYEGQNSDIYVYGPNTTVTDCDFKGIAKTNKGEEEVYIPGGMGAVPMTKVFYYETYSGVWLFLESEDDPAANAVFTNSRIIMNKMSVLNPDMKIRIEETVFMLCNSDFSCPAEYNYDENITCSGNIGVVTGYWGGDYRSGGVFIDILGGYFTFDEETGVLHMNNDYGVRGWLQRTEYGYTGSFIEKDTEIIEKVKKVFIGNDVTYTEYDQWFSGYKNLIEIDFGDSAEWIGHGYPNYVFRGCESLETITIGRNAKYIFGSGSSGMPLFRDCKKLKTLTIKSEQIDDECFNGIQNDWFGDMYLPDLKIYVPTSQVDRFKQAMPKYNNQIIGVDFHDETSILGDVDGDGEVTLVDATILQRFLVNLKIVGRFDEAAADSDGKDGLEIVDSTWIQRHVASMDIPYQLGKPIVQS